MLKSIVNGAEHDIVSIPMKGKNLMPAGEQKTVSNNGITFESDGNGRYHIYGTATKEATAKFNLTQGFITPISVSNNGQGTLSFFNNQDLSNVVLAFYNNESKVDDWRMSPSQRTSTAYNVVGNKYVNGIIIQVASGIQVDMLITPEFTNDGVLPTEFTQHYQNGWEVRDNQNRLIWGREDELETTTGTLMFKGYDLPIKVNSLLGSADQNGTPSPDNVVVPEFCGVRTKNICPSATAETKTNNGITAVSNGSGTYHVSGTATADADIRFNVKSFWIPQSIGNYHDGTFSMFNSAIYDNTAVKLAFYYQGTKLDDWGLTSLNRTNTTYFNMSEKDCDAIGFTVKSGVTVDFTISPEFTNDGVLPTEFEPYGYKISFDNNGENLFDCDRTDGIIDNSYIRKSDGEIVTDTYYYISYPIYVAENMTYTWRFNSETSTAHSVPTVGFYDASDNIIGVASHDNQIRYFSFTTPNGCKYIRASVYKRNNLQREAMLNLGSTPLPYSTYLNKTTPIYLSEVPTIRRIKKLVLTGESDVDNMFEYNGFIYVQKSGMLAEVNMPLCNCLIGTNLPIADAPTNSVKQGVVSNQPYPAALVFKIDGITTTTGFLNFLSTMKSAGTPVTIWYILETPQTGIVNEPLAKIGNYADELTEISVHNLSAPLYGIGDYKDILNLSTGVVTRKVKKIVLDGVNDGEWKKSQTRTGSFYLNVGWNAIVSLGLCDRAVNVSTVSQYDSIGQMLVESSGSTKLINLWLFNTNISLDDFKSYLAAQYQAGTPVTIWYILSTPTTETVTVPTGMTGEIEGYLTQISTPTPTHQSIPKWNGKEETGGTCAITVYTPPEIPTTTGKNTLTVDTTLAPYNVTIDGHIKYTYWGKIREDVRSGLAQTKFPVGTILYDNEDATTGRAFQVVGYDKHFDPSLTARGYNHSMTLCQLKLSGPWQYDAIEAFLYTTVEMQPGTYKFKIPNYDTTYGGNKTYYFTSTVSVPVDSQIVLKWDYQKPPASVTAYAGPNPQTNTTAITGFNALTLTEWVEGESPEAIDLGTIKTAENNPDSAYGKLNHIHRARYGSNNYYQSGLRQLLNTDLTANNWWHPTTIFDRPYANRTTNGYLRSLNEDFINVLATPEITHITNNLFEYPSLDGKTFALNTEYKINTDKAFLLSHTEVGLSASPNIGTILDYYSTHNTNNDRIKYRIDNGNAYYWWFRTPYPARADEFRGCYTSGALRSISAFSSFGVSPAHIIQ